MVTLREYGSGFNLLGFAFLPSFNIEPEQFIQIDQCRKCYRFDHLKPICTHAMYCSPSAEEGHFLRLEVKRSNVALVEDRISPSARPVPNIIKTTQEITTQKRNTYATVTQHSIPRKRKQNNRTPGTTNTQASISNANTLHQTQTIQTAKYLMSYNPP